MKTGNFPGKRNARRSKAFDNNDKLIKAYDTIISTPNVDPETESYARTLRNTKVKEQKTLITRILSVESARDTRTKKYRGGSRF